MSKKYYSIIAIIIFLGAGSFAFSNQDDDVCKGPNKTLASYTNGGKSFLCNVQTYCKNTNEQNYTNNNEKLATKQWIKQDIWGPFEKIASNFLTLEQSTEPPYEEIVSHTQVTSIPYADITTSFQGQTFADHKALYRKRMNSLFNCAVLNSRRTIHKQIIQASNFASADTQKQRQKQLQQIEQALVTNGCRTQASIVPSFQNILLDQVSYEYCVYSYYLTYAHAMNNEKLPELIWNDAKTNDDFYINTDTFADIQKEGNQEINTEIEQTDTVFLESLYEYLNFSKTYEVHALLELIQQDYGAINPKLNELLHPISQTLYKVPNAMGKSSKSKN